MNEIKPNKAELKFLNLAYARFFDIYEVIMNYDFFNISEETRFFYIINIVNIYSELLTYEPINHFIKYINLLKAEFIPLCKSIYIEILYEMFVFIICFPGVRTTLKYQLRVDT